MKFIVSSSTLLKKLQVLGGVINTSNTIPVLDHFLFELNNSKLTITSSDLETTMISSIDVDSTSKGEVAIPSKLLIDTWGKNVGVDIIKQIKNYGKECQKLNKNNAPTPYQFSTDDNY